jgi:hypothetical protein
MHSVLAAAINGDGREKHRLTNDGTWTAVRLVPAFDHTYATRHHRRTLGDITIYHTLLNFGLPA